MIGDDAAASSPRTPSRPGGRILRAGAQTRDGDRAELDRLLDSFCDDRARSEAEGRLAAAEWNRRRPTPTCCTGPSIRDVPQHPDEAYRMGQMLICAPGRYGDRVSAVLISAPGRC